MCESADHVFIFTKQSYNQMAVLKPTKTAVKLPEGEEKKLIKLLG